MRGLAITRFGGDGIEITGGGGHAINSNYFGVSQFLSGKASIAGNGGNGLLIADALKLSVGDGGGSIISGNAQFQSVCNEQTVAAIPGDRCLPDKNGETQK